MDVAVLAVLLIFGIPLMAIAGGVVLAALRILKGGGHGAAEDAEETRMIQDVYHGLRKMEARVEALETILLEKHPKGDKES